MRIREADAACLGEVVALIQELEPDRPLSPDQAAGTLQTMGAYPYYRCFLAQDDGGRIMGTFSLLIADNLGHHGRKLAVVENVVVAADSRGQGVGRAMMEFAYGQAREHGCYKLMLSSSGARDGAHAFYDSLGFERHGISFAVEVDE